MRSPAALLPVLLLLSACDAAATAEAKSDPKLEVQAPVAAVDGGAVVGVDGAAGAAGAGDADAKVEIDAAARTGVLVDGKLTVSADAFKLGSVTTLIQSGTIETAEELELAVNDPEADINTLDIDLDGRIDHIEVVEVREDARVDFQMRVIPSSKASIEHSVELASASLVAVRASSEISYSASFSASVGFSAGASAQANVYSFVTPATFEASAVVVALPLLSWAFIVERPVYHSVFVEAKSGRWIPPGHLKHGLWKATGDSRGHGKIGGKFEGHVGGHGGGNGGKSSPVKHSSKAEASGSKRGSESGSSGGSKGGSKGGSSSKSGSGGGSKGGSGGKSGSGGGSKGGSGGGSKGGSSGGSKSGSGGGGSKGGKGK